MLMTLSYLATIFNVYNLDKNSVLSPILSFGTPPPAPARPPPPHFLILTVTPCFYLFSQIIFIYIKYLNDSKISNTEDTLIFAIVSSFSDFPLHSMQKCIKTLLLLDRPPFVTSAGDIVFLSLLSKVKTLIYTLL